MPNRQPSGTDNDEFSLVSNFDGYISSIDPTNIKNNALIQGSLNVYKKTSNTIANRPGRKLYDASTDSTIASVKSGFIWNTSLGATYPIRCANGKLQVESSISGTRTWYDLLTSLTLTRFVFDTWWDNTDKKDKLLAVNGDNVKVFDWAGGFALFVSYAGNVITLDRSAASAGFASSGTVTINGIDYTYSGISGSTLTGTSDASAASANQVVMSKIVTVTSFSSGPSGTYSCDFIRVVDNQLYLGSYNSQLIYLSKNTDYTSFAQSTPRVTGEGDTVILDSPAKGIGAREGKAYVFAGTDLLYEISFNQITVGAVLSEQTLRQRINLGNLQACLGHEFIDNLSDNIVYLDQSNQLRSFGSFRNIFTAKTVFLSRPVQDELSNEIFTGGGVKVISDRRGDSIYITAPNSGRVYTYREQGSLDPAGNILTERIWIPPFQWNLSRIDSIAGRVIGMSNSNPQFYYLWETNQWHDDAPDGQVSYQSIMLMGYKNAGRRQGKVIFEKLYVEGYEANAELYAGIYYDYQGSTALLSPILNTPSSPFPQLYTGVTPPSLGDASFGDNPLGDGINFFTDDQNLLPKFRVIAGVEPKDCFEYALMIYSTNADARWEVLALGVNERVSSYEGVEIMKSN